MFTAGADGAFFKGIEWASEEDATAANCIRVFVQDAGAGNVELRYEIIIPATTFAAGTTPTAQGSYFPPGGIMLSGASVVKTNLHATDVVAVALVGGGDF